MLCKYRVEKAAATGNNVIKHKSKLTKLEQPFKSVIGHLSKKETTNLRRKSYHYFDKEELIIFSLAHVRETKAMTSKTPLPPPQTLMQWIDNQDYFLMILYK